MLKISFVILLSLTFCMQAQAKEKNLRIAIFPYANPSKILQHNKSLTHFLQRKLQRKVSIITARDGQVYYENVKNKAYDLILCAPHIGRYAELYANYKRVAVTKNSIQGYYIVKKDSDIHRLKDIANKTISMAPATTILHQIALDDLKKVNIFNGKNLKILNTNNHINALFALIKNQSDVALTGVLLWKKLEKKYKKDLRLLVKSTKVLGFTLMAKGSLDESFVQKLKKELLLFEYSKEGKRYPFKGFKKIEDMHMKKLDPYTAVFK